MVTNTTQVSLLAELQSLHKKAKRKSFRCQGITTTGKQCTRKIGLDSRNKLSMLTSDIIKIIDQERGDIKDLLSEASFLVMCTSSQNHQGQAPDKCSTWMEMIPFGTDQLSLDDRDVKPTLPSSVTSSSGDVAAPLPLSDEQETDAGTTLGPQIYDEGSSLLCGHSSPDPDFDDSGYQTGDEQDSMNNSPAPPLTSIRAGHSSTLNETVTLDPKTPKTTPSRDFADSAISLPFDILGERMKKEEVDDDKDGPVSPLAGRAAKGKRLVAKPQYSRPAATPIQPKFPKRSIKSSPNPIKLTPRTFRYYRHPSAELIKYLKTPLGVDDLKDGYVYVFQVEGCTFNKIGYGSLRAGQISLEASSDKRWKEHSRSGWPDAKSVLHQAMPHARRVEQIVHRHLVAGRRVEEYMDKGSNGREPRLRTHTEWFDVPLDEIRMVVKAWSHWMETNPYVKIEGKTSLSSEWTKNLETVPTESAGDPWLEWLERFAPMETTVIGASDATDDPFVTTATIRIKKEECEGATILAPKSTEPPNANYVSAARRGPGRCSLPHEMKIESPPAHEEKSF